MHSEISFAYFFVVNLTLQNFFFFFLFVSAGERCREINYEKRYVCAVTRNCILEASLDDRSNAHEKFIQKKNTSASMSWKINKFAKCRDYMRRRLKQLSKKYEKKRNIFAPKSNLNYEKLIRPRWEIVVKTTKVVLQEAHRWPMRGKTDKKKKTSTSK